MATMIEFSAVLLIHRNCSNNKVGIIDAKRKQKLRHGTEISTNKIDVTAAVLLFLGYIIFNIGYWTSF